MNRGDAEDAEGLGVWSGSDDVAKIHFVPASQDNRMLGGVFSALSASLRFIMSVLNG
jgi:hypothetical protein